MVHADGAVRGGTVRYFAATEYDFERIPVPEVTRGSGPDLVEKSASVFGRIDIETTARSNLTLEGLVFPSAIDAFGLSPLRDPTRPWASRNGPQGLSGQFHSCATNVGGFVGCNVVGIGVPS